MRLPVAQAAGFTEKAFLGKRVSDTRVVHS